MPALKTYMRDLSRRLKVMLTPSDAPVDRTRRFLFGAPLGMVQGERADVVAAEARLTHMGKLMAHKKDIFEFLRCLNYAPVGVDGQFCMYWNDSKYQYYPYYPDDLSRYLDKFDGELLLTDLLNSDFLTEVEKKFNVQLDTEKDRIEENRKIFIQLLGSSLDITLTQTKKIIAEKIAVFVRTRLNGPDEFLGSRDFENLNDMLENIQKVLKGHQSWELQIDYLQQQVIPARKTIQERINQERAKALRIEREAREQAKIKADRALRLKRERSLYTHCYVEDFTHELDKELRKQPRAKPYRDVPGIPAGLKIYKVIVDDSDADRSMKKRMAAADIRRFIDAVTVKNLPGISGDLCRLSYKFIASGKGWGVIGTNDLTLVAVFHNAQELKFPNRPARSVKVAPPSTPGVR